MCRQSSSKRHPRLSPRDTQEPNNFLTKCGRDFWSFNCRCLHQPPHLGASSPQERDGLSSLASIRYHEGIDQPARPEWNTRWTPDEARMSKPRQPRRHHPHLPEVRSRRVPQPDRAAAGPGVAGVRAPAPLRQHAPAHRGGTGPRRPHRPQPDSRPGAEPRSAHGRCSRERKRKILETYETGQVQTRGASELPRPGRGR